MAGCSALRRNGEMVTLSFTFPHERTQPWCGGVVATMAPPFGACSATAALVFVALARIAGGLSDQHHHNALPLAGGSFLQVDRELPGPDLDDGTPTKLYSLSLGRAWHNHTASAELTAAVDAKKLARRDWQGRRALFMSFEDTPLFPGWGTHFAYVYAGTPAQRVSVIIDTGSHFTAFPCAGCRNCGSHTDPPWDYHKSSTSHIVTCEKCHGSFRCDASCRACLYVSPRVTQYVIGPEACKCKWHLVTQCW